MQNWNFTKTINCLNCALNPLPIAMPRSRFAKLASFGSFRLPPAHVVGGLDHHDGGGIALTPFRSTHPGRVLCEVHAQTLCALPTWTEDERGAHGHLREISPPGDMEESCHLEMLLSPTK